MRVRQLFLLCLSLVAWAATAGCGAAAHGQTLAEASRKEAERRRDLEERGVQSRKIDELDLSRSGRGGNLITFSPATFAGRGGGETPGRSGSPAVYRNKLQKLDREIRGTEDKLAMLRQKLAKGRWALPKTGRRSSGAAGGSADERLRDQISDHEMKMKRLRQDRLEVYNAGRKAGFLPGELDGRGHFP